MCVRVFFSLVKHLHPPRACIFINFNGTPLTLITTPPGSWMLRFSAAMERRGKEKGGMDGVMN